MDETLAIPDEDDLAGPEHAPEQAIQVKRSALRTLSLTPLARGYIAIPLCPCLVRPSQMSAPALAPQAGMLSVLDKGQVMAEEPLYLGANHASVLLLRHSLLCMQQTCQRTVVDHCRTQHHRTAQSCSGPQRAASAAMARGARQPQHARARYVRLSLSSGL